MHIPKVLFSETIAKSNNLPNTSIKTKIFEIQAIQESLSLKISLLSIFFHSSQSHGRPQGGKGEASPPPKRKKIVVEK